jgi:hypothetical protein
MEEIISAVEKLDFYLAQGWDRIFKLDSNDLRRTTAAI